MTELEKVLEIALNEVGYLEKKTNSNLDNKTSNAGYNNYTKYARDLDNIPNFYNGKKNGYAWCDMFVDWCFVKALGLDRAKELLNQPNKSYGAGCEESKNYYKKINQFFTTPQIGDQIFFINTNGKMYHTGLVYDVDNTYVYTVEGNTSSKSGVVENGGAVEKKKYKLNYSKIGGYGRPKYIIESEDEDMPRYNTIEEIPEYAKATIQNLIDRKILNGDGTGLNLSEDMIRILVINERTQEYIKNK